MKYIISWIIYTTVTLPCPSGIIGCLVDHRRSDENKMQEIFFNRDSATYFYSMKLIEYKSQFNTHDTNIIMCPKCWNYIGNVKLDSIKNNHQ